GFELQRRTAWPDAGPPAASSHEIWLGDSLGEMARYYGLANVALLGGSFAPLGGQNLIEAAACGCPVVMGPSTFNFAEAAEQAHSAGAASRVKDMAEAVQTAAHFAQSATELARRVQASSDFFETNQGAVQRTASAIKALL
ncbi:MAG: 3-deoxy-D-manno-octulosonic acid transferase, partial [Rhodoferax sp.]|nr:3-deoxy-D-manno-octulosonic acid transferase [Rhodoferax sp.]